MPIWGGGLSMYGVVSGQDCAIHPRIIAQMCARHLAIIPRTKLQSQSAYIGSIILHYYIWGLWGKRQGFIGSCQVGGFGGGLSVLSWS